MFRIILLMIVAGLATLAAAAIKINSVDAYEQPEFLQISVLAEHEADYGVNEQVIAIPAVSVEIIADAAQDFQAQSSVQTITYTSIPTKEPNPDSEGNGDTGSVDESRHDNGPGNAVVNDNHANQGNNENGSSNSNNGNNGNQRDKNKEKDKDKGNRGSGNDKGSESENTSEKSK